MTDSAVDYFNDELAKHRQRLPPTINLHPLLECRRGLEMLKDLSVAQNERQWNRCLGQLVTFLFLAATPRQEGEIEAGSLLKRANFLLYLQDFISRGRKIPSNRPSRRLQAQIDSRNTELRAAKTMQQALSILERRDFPPHDGSFDGATADERRKMRDNYRDRLERAEAVGGFRVPRRAKRKAEPKG